MTDPSNKAPDSGSSARKFTLSCSRCRASKLKCDRNEPCMECVKRNIGHLCTKDERQPRAKRTKTEHSNHNNQNNQNNQTNSQTNSPQTQERETEAEEAAHVLEHFIDGTRRTNAYPFGVSTQTSSPVARDYDNGYWLDSDPKRQDEKFALIRDIVDALPELEVIHLLYEIFVTRCQGALGNVVHTPTLLEQAEQFSSCLDPVSPETQVMALSITFSMDELGRYLLALVLGLAFHPTPFIMGWSSTSLTLRVEELRASDVHAKTWRSLALRCLHGGASLFCGSIPSLQAAIMLLLDGQEDSLALDAVLVTAISGAQKLGLHRLGNVKLDASASSTASLDDGSSASAEPPYIRTEIGIRIWWALVMRDWSRGQALGYYAIHPSQFNTRMPLHINDEDLCPGTLVVNTHGHITERPRSEFTMLSYTVHTLEMAAIVRESIDLSGSLRLTGQQEEIIERGQTQSHLYKKYEKFVTGLPSHYRLGSTAGLTSTGPMAAIPVQRWMLHQQLWSLFLRLHRANLSSPDGRTSCQLMAQNIISTQAQIQARCTVCAALSTGKTQLFNAAVVLLINLLFTSKHKEAHYSNAQLVRLMTRDKVREAIELLRRQGGAEGSSPPSQNSQLEQIDASAPQSAVLLEALMKLEEEESGDSGESNTLNPTRICLGDQSHNTASKSLKEKVMDVLEKLEGNKQASFNLFAADMSVHLPPGSDGFADLDLLPLLYNDLSPDFWEFLDFLPPPVDFHTENSSSAELGDRQSESIGLSGSEFAMVSSSTGT